MATDSVIEIFVLNDVERAGNIFVPCLDMSTLSMLPLMCLPNGKLNEQFLRRKSSRRVAYGNASAENLGVDVASSLVSLPIIYMSRELFYYDIVLSASTANELQLRMEKLEQVNRTINSLRKNSNKDEIDLLIKLNLHQITLLPPKKSTVVRAADRLVKRINWLKQSIGRYKKNEVLNSNEKEKCDTNTASITTSNTTATTGTPSSGVPGVPKVSGAPSGPGTISNLKKESSKPAINTDFSWSKLEKKLPVWQNQIADFLQKLQDLVFKKPK